MYLYNVFSFFFLHPATVLKTEAGSLPEGKVKLKLEHDGTILDVDEDDIEKVRPSRDPGPDGFETVFYQNILVL